jgi:hypothetical protein
VTLGGCALCVLQGVAGHCPHRDPGTPAASGPPDDEWPHYPGVPGGKERRTLSADEARDAVDRMLIAGELAEVEHRWS